ncbi:MAG: right-handed parallel beta-helix repeat-containing protein [Verrucomicrobiae bacterium]|nr:right-handed parallel beta-helix repeat-containing protein [Verrucomicrobiae bacterium]MCP5540151.1 right-handed parallel beta-helix repeat-containing protein [Akkermansiaceae bacterium]
MKTMHAAGLVGSVWMLAGAAFCVGDEIRVPEDRPTIQAAIDAAESGDVVRVSPGTYRERIRLKPGVILRGAGDNDKAGAEATILDGGGENGDAPGVTMAEGATLDGFTVTNVGRYDEAVWQKNWEEKGAKQAHEHIGNFGVPAIAIAGVDCTVIRNMVHHNGDTGIAIRGVEGKRCAPLVADNLCYRNMGGGIGSMHGSTAIITGNECRENFYAGIGHDDASPLVMGNICHGNIRAGIGISEGASPVVRGNQCFENRRAGIGIRTGANTRPVVEDNDCHHNEMAGIGVEEEAEPVLRGNRCHHNTLAGIGSQSGARPVLVENHCHDNAAAGIGARSGEAIAIRNRVEKNGSTGIGVEGDARAVLVGNLCEENRLVAVGVPAGGEAVLVDNTLVRTGGMPPIVAILKGATAAMVGNTVRGGGVGAVMLDGRLRAVANTLEGANGGSGIVVRKEAEAFLSGNTITGYRKPVSGEGRVVGEPEGRESTR